MRRLLPSLHLLLLALWSCGEPILVGRVVDAGGPPDAGRDAAGSGVDGSEAGTALCPERGPELEVGDGAGASCAGGDDTRGFRFGVCSCGDLVGNAPLYVDAFDSAESSSELLDSGSVGVNGEFRAGPATLDGSLWIASAAGAGLTGDLQVGANLKVQGAVQGDANVSVTGDAEVAGDIRLATLSVGGTLTQPEQAELGTSEGPAPEKVVGEVRVPPPCDCSAGPDVTARVEALAEAHDNALIGLEMDGLDSSDGPLELRLPCGRYYVSRLLARHPLTITVEGHVTLAVAGDVNSVEGGPVRFQLAPDAELDLLVAGAITTADALYVGDAATAGRARVYAGTQGTLDLSGDTLVGGPLFAPAAELVASGGLEVFGALLTRRFAYSAQVRVHYDQALARDECTGAACTDSAQCGTRSCQDGTCSLCDSTTPCAPGLRCIAGSCLP